MACIRITASFRAQAKYMVLSKLLLLTQMTGKRTNSRYHSNVANMCMEGSHWDYWAGSALDAILTCWFWRYIF